MRLFLASYLSADAQRTLSAEIATVIAAIPGALRPVPASSEHFTHAFLGESARPVAEILDALAPIANTGRVAIRLGGARVLRGRGRPRLICVGVLDGERDLQALGVAIRDRLAAFFPALAAQRETPPHVTLARFTRRARRRDGHAVEALLARRGPTAWELPAIIERIELVHSRLTPRGPIYETLGEIILDS